MSKNSVHSFVNNFVELQELFESSKDSSTFDAPNNINYIANNPDTAVALYGMFEEIRRILDALVLKNILGLEKEPQYSLMDMWIQKFENFAALTGKVSSGSGISSNFKTFFNKLQTIMSDFSENLSQRKNSVHERSVEDFNMMIGTLNQVNKTLFFRITEFRRWIGFCTNRQMYEEEKKMLEKIASYATNAEYKKKIIEHVDYHKELLEKDYKNLTDGNGYDYTNNQVKNLIQYLYKTKIEALDRYKKFFQVADQYLFDKTMQISMHEDIKNTKFLDLSLTDIEQQLRDTFSQPPPTSLDEQTFQVDGILDKLRGKTFSYLKYNDKHEIVSDYTLLNADDAENRLYKNLGVGLFVDGNNVAQLQKISEIFLTNSIYFSHNFDLSRILFMISDKLNHVKATETIYPSFVSELYTLSNAFIYELECVKMVDTNNQYMLRVRLNGHFSDDAKKQIIKSTGNVRSIDSQIYDILLKSIDAVSYGIIDRITEFNKAVMGEDKSKISESYDKALTIFGHGKKNRDFTGYMKESTSQQYSAFDAKEMPYYVHLSNACAFYASLFYNLQKETKPSEKYIAVKLDRKSPFFKLMQIYTKGTEKLSYIGGDSIQNKTEEMFKQLVNLFTTNEYLNIVIEMNKIRNVYGNIKSTLITLIQEINTSLHIYAAQSDEFKVFQKKFEKETFIPVDQTLQNIDNEQSQKKNFDDPVKPVNDLYDKIGKIYGNIKNSSIPSHVLVKAYDKKLNDMKEILSKGNINAMNKFQMFVELYKEFLTESQDGKDEWELFINSVIMPTISLISIIDKFEAIVLENGNKYRDFNYNLLLYHHFLNKKTLIDLPNLNEIQDQSTGYLIEKMIIALKAHHKDRADGMSVSEFAAYNVNKQFKDIDEYNEYIMRITNHNLVNIDNKTHFFTFDKMHFNLASSFADTLVFVNDKGRINIDKLRNYLIEFINDIKEIYQKLKPYLAVRIITPLNILTTLRNKLSRPYFQNEFFYTSLDISSMYNPFESEAFKGIGNKSCKDITNLTTSVLHDRMLVPNNVKNATTGELKNIACILTLINDDELDALVKEANISGEVSPLFKNAYDIRTFFNKVITTLHINGAVKTQTQDFAFLKGLVPDLNAYVGATKNLYNKAKTSYSKDDSYGIVYENTEYYYDEGLPDKEKVERPLFYIDVISSYEYIKKKYISIAEISQEDIDRYLTFLPVYIGYFKFILNSLKTPKNIESFEPLALLELLETHSQLKTANFIDPEIQKQYVAPVVPRDIQQPAVMQGLGRITNKEVIDSINEENEYNIAQQFRLSKGDKVNEQSYTLDEFLQILPRFQNVLDAADYKKLYLLLKAEKKIKRSSDANIENRKQLKDLLFLMQFGFVKASDGIRVYKLIQESEINKEKCTKLENTMLDYFKKNLGYIISAFVPILFDLHINPNIEHVNNFNACLKLMNIQEIDLPFVATAQNPTPLLNLQTSMSKSFRALVIHLGVADAAAGDIVAGAGAGAAPAELLAYQTSIAKSFGALVTHLGAVGDNGAAVTAAAGATAQLLAYQTSISTSFRSLVIHLGVTNANAGDIVIAVVGVAAAAAELLAYQTSISKSFGALVIHLGAANAGAAVAAGGANAAAQLLAYQTSISTSFGALVTHLGGADAGAVVAAAVGAANAAAATELLAYQTSISTSFSSLINLFSLKDRIELSSILTKTDIASQKIYCNTLFRKQPIIDEIKLYVPEFNYTDDMFKIITENMFYGDVTKLNNVISIYKHFTKELCCELHYWDKRIPCFDNIKNLKLRNMLAYIKETMYQALINDPGINMVGHVGANAGNVLDDGYNKETILYRLFGSPIGIIGNGDKYGNETQAMLDFICKNMGIEFVAKLCQSLDNRYTIMNLFPMNLAGADLNQKAFSFVNLFCKSKGFIDLCENVIKQVEQEKVLEKIFKDKYILRLAVASFNWNGMINGNAGYVVGNNNITNIIITKRLFGHINGITAANTHFASTTEFIDTIKNKYGDIIYSMCSNTTFRNQFTNFLRINWDNNKKIEQTFKTISEIDLPINTFISFNTNTIINIALDNDTILSKIQNNDIYHIFGFSFYKNVSLLKPIYRNFGNLDGDDDTEKTLSFLRKFIKNDNIKKQLDNSFEEAKKFINNNINNKKYLNLIEPPNEIDKDISKLSVNNESVYHFTPNINYAGLVENQETIKSINLLLTDEDKKAIRYRGEGSMLWQILNGDDTWISDDYELTEKDIEHIQHYLFPHNDVYLNKQHSNWTSHYTKNWNSETFKKQISKYMRRNEELLKNLKADDDDINSFKIQVRECYMGKISKSDIDAREKFKNRYLNEYLENYKTIKNMKKSYKNEVMKNSVAIFNPKEHGTERHKNKFSAMLAIEGGFVLREIERTPKIMEFMDCRSPETHLRKQKFIIVVLNLLSLRKKTSDIKALRKYYKALSFPYQNVNHDETNFKQRMKNYYPSMGWDFNPNNKKIGYPGIEIELCENTATKQQLSNIYEANIASMSKVVRNFNTNQLFKTIVNIDFIYDKIDANNGGAFSAILRNYFGDSVADDAATAATAVGTAGVAGAAAAAAADAIAAYDYTNSTLNETTILNLISMTNDNAAAPIKKLANTIKVIAKLKLLGVDLNNIYTANIASMSNVVRNFNINQLLKTIVNIDFIYDKIDANNGGAFSAILRNYFGDSVADDAATAATAVGTAGVAGAAAAAAADAIAAYDYTNSTLNETTILNLISMTNDNAAAPIKKLADTIKVIAMISLGTWSAYPSVYTNNSIPKINTLDTFDFELNTLSNHMFNLTKNGNKYTMKEILQLKPQLQKTITLSSQDNNFIKGNNLFTGGSSYEHMFENDCKNTRKDFIEYVFDRKFNTNKRCDYQLCEYYRPVNPFSKKIDIFNKLQEICKQLCSLNDTEYSRSIEYFKSLANVAQFKTLYLNKYNSPFIYHQYTYTNKQFEKIVIKFLEKRGVKIQVNIDYASLKERYDAEKEIIEIPDEYKKILSVYYNVQNLQKYENQNRSDLMKIISQNKKLPQIEINEKDTNQNIINKIIIEYGKQLINDPNRNRNLNDLTTIIRNYFSQFPINNYYLSYCLINPNSMNAIDYINIAKLQLSAQGQNEQNIQEFLNVQKLREDYFKIPNRKFPCLYPDTEEDLFIFRYYIYLESSQENDKNWEGDRAYMKKDFNVTHENYIPTFESTVISGRGNKNETNDFLNKLINNGEMSYPEADMKEYEKQSSVSGRALPISLISNTLIANQSDEIYLSIKNNAPYTFKSTDKPCNIFGGIKLFILEYMADNPDVTLLEEHHKEKIRELYNYRAKGIAIMTEVSNQYIQTLTNLYNTIYSKDRIIPHMKKSKEDIVKANLESKNKITVPLNSTLVLLDDLNSSVYLPFTGNQGTIKHLTNFQWILNLIMKKDDRKIDIETILPSVYDNIEKTKSREVFGTQTKIEEDFEKILEKYIISLFINQDLTLFKSFNEVKRHKVVFTGELLNDIKEDMEPLVDQIFLNPNNKSKFINVNSFEEILIYLSDNSLYFNVFKKLYDIATHNEEKTNDKLFNYLSVFNYFRILPINATFPIKMITGYYIYRYDELYDNYLKSKKYLKILNENDIDSLKKQFVERVKGNSYSTLNIKTNDEAENEFNLLLTGEYDTKYKYEPKYLSESSYVYTIKFIFNTLFSYKLLKKFYDEYVSKMVQKINENDM